MAKLLNRSHSHAIDRIEADQGGSRPVRRRVACIARVEGGWRLCEPRPGYWPHRTQYPTPTQGDAAWRRQARNQRKRHRQAMRSLSWGPDYLFIGDVCRSRRAAHREACRLGYSHSLWQGTLRRCKEVYDA